MPYGKDYCACGNEADAGTFEDEPICGACMAKVEPEAEEPSLSDVETVADLPPAERRLVFTKASSITPRPVRWAWDTAPDAEPADREGRFPVGSLVLAVGRAGVGKSQFACWLTAKITTGTLPGAGYGQARSVMYAATEDSWEMTIVPRLMAAGADLDRVYHVRVVSDTDMHARLTLPSDTHMLERGLVAHGVALVVMDPLLSLIDSSINDYRAREVREALEPLVALADRTRVLLLGLAHFTKGSGSDPLMLVSGSAAFGQLVRSAVAFARDDEAEDEVFVCSTIKNNLGRENLPSLAYRISPHSVDTPEGEAWVSRLEFTGEEATRSVGDLLRGAQNGNEDPDEVEQWLTNYLSEDGGSAKANDIYKAADAAGYSKDQAKRAKKRIGITATHPDIKGPWFWQLPSGLQGSKGSDVPDAARKPPLSAPLDQGAGAQVVQLFGDTPEEPSA